jgi:hypothetical protein
MKKFSLKALGATLLVAGLVLAGVATPAGAAATAAWTSGQPTFAVGSTPAMDITFTPTNTSSSAPFRQVAVTVKDAWGDSISLGNITSGSLAGCLLSTIGGGHVQIQSNTCTRVNTYPASYNLISLENAGGGGSGSAYGAFNFSLLSGVATGLSAGQTYTIWVATMNDSTVVESATLSVTIPAATSQVTFNANGGTGTMPNQSSNVSAALNTNTFTRAGYTFTGWNFMANGIGNAYADGATYNFLSSRTLFAQWTPGGSGGGSSTSATLTINLSTGQLVAGSTVAVAASGLQATAPYTVVVQSTPQTIGSGNATAGAVNTSVTLPAGLEAGWHTLTFTSTGSNGSAVTSVTYFKVSASGTLLATASTIPAELASTGFDGLPYLATGGMLALAGVTIMLFARRRFGN